MPQIIVRSLLFTMARRSQTTRERESWIVQTRCRVHREKKLLATPKGTFLSACAFQASSTDQHSCVNNRNWHVYLIYLPHPTRNAVIVSYFMIRNAHLVLFSLYVTTYAHFGWSTFRSLDLQCFFRHPLTISKLNYGKTWPCPSALVYHSSLVGDAFLLSGVKSDSFIHKLHYPGYVICEGDLDL